MGTIDVSTNNSSEDFLKVLHERNAIANKICPPPKMAFLLNLVAFDRVQNSIVVHNDFSYSLFGTPVYVENDFSEEPHYYYDEEEKIKRHVEY